MRYKIKDIPAEGQVVQLALEPAFFRDALDGLGVEVDRTAGAARLELHRTHEDVYVRGELAVTLGLQCAACLGPARAEVKLPLQLVFKREDDEALVDDESDDPLADEAEVFPHDGKQIDLTQPLREQLILAVPMTARCKDDCRGLCPVCGQDRNQAECGHTQPESGGGKQPFAALKDLKLE